MGMQNPVEASLRTVDAVFSAGVVPAPIRQYGHDLPWWQRCKFRLVAGQQDGLAFLLTEAMSHVAVAALATIDTITVTSELPAPALQRRQTHAQQQRQLTGTGTDSDALIEDLQSLLAINRRRQSSASSPQKALIFFAAINRAAASARAFSLRLSSCYSCGEAFGYRRLISRWCWARSFSSSRCSFKVSTGLSLASWDACRHRSTCSGKRPRSRQ